MNKQAFVPVPRDLLDNVVRYVEVSSLLAKKALDECTVHRQAQKRASTLQGDVLAHLLSLGVVGAPQKEAAAAMLGSHAETLSLLKLAGDKLAAITEANTKLTKRAGLGEGEDDPVGGDKPSRNKEAMDSLNDPRVGGRSSFVKESDRPLMALIGK